MKSEETLSTNIESCNNRRELSKNVRDFLLKISIVTGLILSNPQKRDSSEFGDNVLNESIALTTNQKQNKVCNTSFIGHNGNSYILTAKHCSSSYNGIYKNGDLLVKQHRKSENIIELNYNIDIQDSELIGKSVKIIGYLPFKDKGKTYKVGIEYNINIMGISEEYFNLPKGQILGILNLKELDETINKLAADKGIKVNKPQLLSGLSGSPIFLNKKVIGVLSTSIGVNDSFIAKEILRFAGIPKGYTIISFTGPELLRKTIKGD